jgi:hypothetical protein
MRLPITFAFLVCFLFQSQAQIDHWESVVLAENQWSYLLPSEELPTDWNQVGFDDSAWLVGAGGMGHGDNDDGTVIANTNAVFLRHTFNIEDLSAIEASIFHMDYDDAFVAYLNGVEIARSNIGTPGDSPSYNQFSDGLHEAQMYQGGNPDEFVLSNLESLFLEGENVLSIQAHNANSGSSDLSSNGFLHVGLYTTETLYQTIPSWFNPPSECLGFDLTIFTAAWGGEVFWSIVNENDEMVYNGNGYADDEVYNYELCLEVGCYVFELGDTYGDGWNGGYFILEDQNGNEVISGTLDNGYQDEIIFGVESWCPILGCMDSEGLNYDPGANTDDGSCVFFETSHLPLVVITTDGQGIPDNPRITAHMGIIQNTVGDNSLDDEFNNYDGQISIEIRGSSSQMFPKKSFGLETQLPDGTNNNVSLLDMPVENDWILHAPFSDKSLMRNALTFELGRKAGRYTVRNKYCELFINGEYQGLYMLMESVKVDNDRVDIATLLPEDIDGDEVTGGYILKVDKFTGNGGEGWYSDYLVEGGNDLTYIQFHRPRADDLVQQQKDYIESYVNNFEDVLFSDEFANPETGYANYIDPSSFIDLSLINELSRNIDGYRLSTYFYKDKDSNGGRLTMGPWWDYNLAYANANYCDGGNPEGWEVNSGCGNENPRWFERLKEDPIYLNNLRCRWDILRSNLWSDSALTFMIDSLDNRLGEASLRNFAAWDILGTYVWPNVYTDSESHQDEVDFLKSWVDERTVWMDSNLEGICPAGCTDVAACNFDPAAELNNGTCEYVEVFSIGGTFATFVDSIHAYAYPETFGSTYAWEITGGTIVFGQGANTVQVIWTEVGAGSISILETNEEGCSGELVVLEVEVTVYVHVASWQHEELKVFPNPSNGNFRIDLPSSNTSLQLRIVDMTGRVVFSQQLLHKKTIDIHVHLAEGVYLLEVVGSNNNYVSTLVIR